MGDSNRPNRFMFHNHIITTHLAPRGSMTREELYKMLKRIVLDPEGIISGTLALSFDAAQCGILTCIITLIYTIVS